MSVEIVTQYTFVELKTDLTLPGGRVIPAGTTVLLAPAVPAHNVRVPGEQSLYEAWGSLSKDGHTHAAATAAALGMVKPDNSSIVVDAEGIISAISGGGSMLNAKQVIEADQTFTAPLPGWYKFTLIGGGGSGGAGGAYSSANNIGIGGAGGNAGGSTSAVIPAGALHNGVVLGEALTLTAAGGSGGGGGGALASGGGGGAGEVNSAFVWLPQNVVVALTVGAGGASATGSNGSAAAGAAGAGSNAGQGGKAFAGATGATGAGNGQSFCFDGIVAGWCGPGGNGAVNPFGYGHGGGGGGGTADIETGIGVGGQAGGAGAQAGGTPATLTEHAAGGAGGKGAVIIEYSAS